MDIPKKYKDMVAGYEEEDGVMFLYSKNGYCIGKTAIHFAEVLTLAEIKAKMRTIKACKCDDCKNERVDWGDFL